MILTDDQVKEKICLLTGDDPFVLNMKTEKWYSYKEIWSNAILLSKSETIKNSNSIIAIMENGIDLFTLYFACMISNTTVIPLDPQKAENELNKIINENPDSPVLRDIDSLIDEKRAIIDDEIYKMICQIDFDKVFMITYTSGSTGHAKGVIHNLRNLFMAAYSFGKATGLTQEYTMCHVMPMTYMAGILNTIIMPFLFGCKIVILPRFDVMSAISFWKNVEKHSVSAFWLSPSMLNILMTVDRKGRAKEYLSQIKPLFYIGTAPLFENIREKFESKYDVKLLQSYGLSETLFISTERPDINNDSKSVGTLLEDVKLNLYDDQEIGIDVPWMFLGYSNEKTEEYFRDNNYMSGDLGKVIDNRLYITGRKKDLIIKGGMNISPSQIEECINTIGIVRECAVTGVLQNDEENIVCWYVEEKDKEFSGNIVNKIIEDKLGRHCRIDTFVLLNEIPKNLNGKTDKKALVEGFGK